MTSSDKDKCRIKLGRKPHNPEGTKNLFDATKALCDVLFGEDNVFSGPIAACGLEMMKVGSIFVQQQRTEAELMQKLGDPCIYALWDCFNRGFETKLTNNDVVIRGNVVNLGKLLHTLDTLQRGELPSTDLLPEYFQPKQHRVEARSEEINKKRSPSTTTNSTEDVSNTRQQKRQRRQEKPERKLYTYNLPNDVKSLVEKCLELNNSGKTPALSTEWIRNHFDKTSNAQLREALNLKPNDCHVVCCFGRCNRSNGCKLNHKGIGNYNFEAYKKNVCRHSSTVSKTHTHTHTHTHTKSVLCIIHKTSNLHVNEINSNNMAYRTTIRSFFPAHHYASKKESYDRLS